LKGNQRYLAKAVYLPDVNFPVNQQPNTDAVTWQFRIAAHDGATIEQGWQRTGKGQYKQREENLWVFETTAPVTIDYCFLARSVYAGNDCDFWVYEMTLEEVAPDYGGTNVPKLGQGSAQPQTPSTAPHAPTMPAPPQQHSPPPQEMVSITNMTGPTGKSLGDVLTADDIDVIAAGLRAMASTGNPTAAIGLNRLAEVLERLK
jgi:hypothetical protein